MEVRLSEKVHTEEAHFLDFGVEASDFLDESVPGVLAKVEMATSREPRLVVDVEPELT